MVALRNLWNTVASPPMCCFDVMFGTFSKMKILGSLLPMCAMIGVMTEARRSRLPAFLPADENGWQGNPATYTSVVGKFLWSL
jgi:hypothetical protein